MSDQSARLHKHVADFVAEVKHRCPDATVEVSYQPYETEDARLVVRPPSSWTLEQCEDLAEHTADMMSDLLTTTGLSIPILLIEPQDSVRREKDLFMSTRKKAS